MQKFVDDLQKKTAEELKKKADAPAKDAAPLRRSNAVIPGDAQHTRGSPRRYGDRESNAGQMRRTASVHDAAASKESCHR